MTDLLPVESIALTVALAQVQRGESPDPNTAAMCVLALARIEGRHDWTDAADEDSWPHAPREPRPVPR